MAFSKIVLAKEGITLFPHQPHMLTNHKWISHQKILYKVLLSSPFWCLCSETDVNTYSTLSLQRCIYALTAISLNLAKTELIWFGSKASLKKTVDLDLNLYIGADVIKPVSVVQDIRVSLDSEVNMDQHVKTVLSAAVFFIFDFSDQFGASREVTLGLMSAFIPSGLIIIIIIIIWFGETVTVTNLTKCNTYSKVRAMSA